jgi:hypothetical protein
MPIENSNRREVFDRRIVGSPDHRITRFLDVPIAEKAGVLQLRSPQRGRI